MSAGSAGCLGVPEQLVAAADRVRAQVGERLQVADQLVDLALAGETRRARPSRRMIAPLQQLEAGAAQPLQRAIVLLVGRPCANEAAAASGARLRTARPGAAAPSRERLVEQPLGVAFGQHLEQRIDRRLDRPLAQQIGAEAVDGADVRLFELLDRAVRAARAVARRRRTPARASPAPRAAAASARRRPSR